MQLGHHHEDLLAGWKWLNGGYHGYVWRIPDVDTVCIGLVRLFVLFLHPRCLHVVTVNQTGAWLRI